MVDRIVQWVTWVTGHGHCKWLTVSSEVEADMARWDGKTAVTHNPQSVYRPHIADDRNLQADSFQSAHLCGHKQPARQKATPPAASRSTSRQHGVNSSLRSYSQPSGLHCSDWPLRAGKIKGSVAIKSRLHELCTYVILAWTFDPFQRWCRVCTTGVNV